MRPIGIHISYWQTTWLDALIPLFLRAKSAGFAGVELPLLNPENLNVTEIAAALTDQGLRCTCGTGLSPTTDITSPSLATRDAGFSHLKKCLQISAALGSPGVGGVTYAPWAIFPEEPIEVRRQRCIESLRQIGDFAENLGQTLFLEVVNRFEGDLIHTVDQGREVLDMIGSPAIKLHLDTFHMNIEEDNIESAIYRAGRQLGHFHCSENNRKIPGKGSIPWKQVRQALDKIDYQEWLVIESFVRPAGEVGRGLFIWRPLGVELDQDAAQGAQFLRQEVCGV